MNFLASLPPSSVGLRLARINRAGDLILCEEVVFERGRAAVDMVLRRAALAGRVEFGTKIEDHFADVMDAEGDIVETVTLDRHSYSALKNHWMRCRVQPNDTAGKLAAAFNATKAS